jgi:ergothioneine biosynthesis protein EgtB
MAAEELIERYARVRSATLAVAGRFSHEQHLVQSEPFASPVKWHLAHTTWFFERMVLRELDPRPPPYDPAYDYLFNSYYEGVGARTPRAQRGLITRPTLDEVHAYRSAIDARMLDALPRLPEALRAVARLGCEHEQQHQELILTDAKHALHAGAEPVLVVSARAASDRGRPRAERFVPHQGGLCEIGAVPQGFAYDNERPRHRVWVEPFELASRCVTNAAWLAFIDDGGYRDPLLWLSDGWETVQRESWQAPLYWVRSGAGFAHRTLEGITPLDPNAPVCHVSFYEADAYARWRARSEPGSRLPTEAEWEVMAATHPIEGNFLEQGALVPMAASASSEGVQQMFGDVWEWTASPYVAYPRFTPLAGALSEYNGKFMCNQLVLRGGSCLSPQDHLRATYRNFFPPSARWQMTGVRLARYAGDRPT